MQSLLRLGCNKLCVGLVVTRQYVGGIVEIIAYLVTPFLASGAIYYLAKPLLDSIWNGFLTLLGKSGALGEESVQHSVYQLMTRRVGTKL